MMFGPGNLTTEDQQRAMAQSQISIEIQYALEEQPEIIS